MKGRRIAFLANTAWSMYNFRISTLTMLQKLGAEVIVIAPPDDYSVRFSSFGIRFVPLYRLKAKGTNPLADFRLYQEFIAVFKRIEPHLLISYTIKPNIYGILAARSLHIRSIAVITGLGYGIAKGGIMRAMVERLYRFSLRHASSVWFLNKDDHAYFTDRRMLGLAASKVIPGEGISVEHFKRKVAYPDGETTKFIYSGRLLYDKGVADFVEAIRVLRKEGLAVEGVLLGFTDTLNPSAISSDTVEAWEREGVIRYLGKTSDVRPFIEQIHCMVFPSYYSEGIPRCLLEAASMEVPAITTDHVGCREVVIDNTTGFLTTPKDIASLVAGMRRFAQLPTEERVSMGKAARDRVVQHYRDQFIHAIYVQQINEILQSPAQ
ncbi:glycosyltransferase family 4 protein [Parapedobacter luteus]|nr:glycosyltransferase family 4 protein [Parapedobacter luteus]